MAEGHSSFNLVLSTRIKSIPAPDPPLAPGLSREERADADPAERGPILCVNE